MNLIYLNEGMKQTGHDREFLSEEAVFKQLDEIIDGLKPDFILKDIERFLEHPEEEIWLRQYRDVYFQLRKEML
jgi:hypothetical protein